MPIGNTLVNAPVSLPISTITQANLLLTTYFENMSTSTPCLISVPSYTHTSTSVSISVFYFLGANGTVSLANDEMDVLSSILTTILGKEVHLVLTRVHYPYMNAYILAQYLAYNANSHTFMNYQEAILLYPSFSQNNTHGHVTGIKIALHGRLVTEALVPRITTNMAMVGYFPDPNIVDYASYTSKNDLGKFTIKVWLGQAV